MYVELLIGRLAGEVVYIRADAAKKMLEDGRARRPGTRDIQPEAAVVEPEERAVIKPAKKKRWGKRS